MSTGEGITDAEMREILAQCAERRGWPNTAKNVRDDNIFSGKIEIGNVFAAMRAVEARTRAAASDAEAVDLLRQAISIFENCNVTDGACCCGRQTCQTHGREVMALTAAQERNELLTFLRRAVEYFDREAESAPRRVDPAALYAEGRVVLLRLEHDEGY